MMDVKLQDVKQTDEISGHEIAGHENAGHENGKHENVLAYYAAYEWANSRAQGTSIEGKHRRALQRSFCGKDGANVWSANLTHVTKKCIEYSTNNKSCTTSSSHFLTYIGQWHCRQTAEWLKALCRCWSVKQLSDNFRTEFAVVSAGRKLWTVLYFT